MCHSLKKPLFTPFLCWFILFQFIIQTIKNISFHLKLFYLSLLDNIGGIKNISKINRIKIKKQQQISVKSRTRMGYFDDEDGWMLVRYWRSQRRPGRANIQQQQVTWGMDCGRLSAFDWGGKSQSSFPNHIISRTKIYLKKKNVYQTHIKITNNTYLKTFQ